MVLPVEVNTLCTTHTGGIFHTVEHCTDALSGITVHTVQQILGVGKEH